MTRPSLSSSLIMFLNDFALITAAEMIIRMVTKESQNLMVLIDPEKEKVKYPLAIPFLYEDEATPRSNGRDPRLDTITKVENNVGRSFYK